MEHPPVNRRRPRPTHRTGAWVSVLGAVALTAGALTACSSEDEAPSLVGVWSASDGSGTKTVSEDGRCSGMYWNNGQPLDIGGGMTCTLNEAGNLLVVEQPPNTAQYDVSFSDADTVVLSQNGSTVVTLTRQ